MIWIMFCAGAVIGAFSTLTTVAVTSEEVRRWRQRKRHKMLVQFGRMALVAESNGIVAPRRWS